MRLSLPIALLLCSACEQPSSAPAPNVVLITIDTLRADRLGVYGHERETSPHIDELARNGLVFERAYAHAPWTLPSMVSIFTSLYPGQHGAFERDRSLPSDIPVLAETLQSAGYETMGVVSQLFVSSRYGFSRGFDRFNEENDFKRHPVSSRLLTEQAQEFVRERAGGAFFLWVHYFDPHATYMAHDAYDFAADYEGPLPRDIVMRKLTKNPDLLSPADVEYLRARYDGEVAFTDEWIGALLAELEQQELMEDTLVFVTSDHGEAFLEHRNLGHGKWCYEELVHVPLIVGGGALPDALRGLRFGPEIETRSIARTIAGACGIESSFGGVDLLRAALDDEFEGFAWIEGSHAMGKDQRRRSVIADGWKLIRRIDQEDWELFDLRNDPAEKTNLFESEDERATAARLRLVPLVEGGPEEGSAPRLTISPEEMEDLRALGYAED